MSRTLGQQRESIATLFSGKRCLVVLRRHYELKSSALKLREEGPQNLEPIGYFWNRYFLRKPLETRTVIDGPRRKQETQLSHAKNN